MTVASRNFTDSNPVRKVLDSLRPFAPTVCLCGSVVQRTMSHCSRCRRPAEHEPEAPRAAPFRPPAARKRPGQNQYTARRRGHGKHDLAGRVFDRLTAKEYLGGGLWRCVCQCGGERVVETGYLTQNRVGSCLKCTRAEANKKRLASIKAKRAAAIQ